MFGWTAWDDGRFVTREKGFRRRIKGKKGRGNSILWNNETKEVYAEKTEELCNTEKLEKRKRTHWKKNEKR